MSEKEITDFGSPGEQYVKKRIPIEAKQLPFAFSVKTIEGTMSGKPMDYLLKGVKGELYPCDKEIFETTYEAADKQEEQDVWVFNKEGFLSIAQSDFEKGKMIDCLEVEPRKAKLVYEGEHD